ncbi:MAG: UPF0323 family lipoprotein [Arcobacteraceae bacterium]|jgi:hypothetical protein|nr:UPF0323 family lipoprotein [Arcobacteraceae bacterium]
MKKDKKYFLKQISNFAIVGGFGSLLILNFAGCENKQEQQQNESALSNVSEKKNVFVVIEKAPDGSYKIVDEFPSTNTTIVLREDGKERILSKEEIDKLVAVEAQKIDNNTSGLTNPSMSSGGMSLGETLLASAAGAMIGAYIGNKLFNNNNYNTQRQTNYKSPQTYSKSVNSFNNPSSGASTKNSATSSGKSGYFSNSNKATSSSSSYGG